jgi:AraC-like DNA-binding protein
MRSQNTRSGGEGLERSCKGTAAGWLASTEPVEGVELLHAWLTTEVYQRHRHDTYAVGVTDRGVQVFDYRGSARASTRGQVVVLYPDEAHDGRAGTDEAFGGSLDSLSADSIVVGLAEALLAAERCDARPARSRRVDVAAVERARQLLDAERTRAVHSSELEPITGLTRYELARQFRAVLGTSPHRYLLMRRLAFARDLIHAARPLVEVACEAGFADQAHFTRVFKSAFGLTPAGYRALRIDPVELTGRRAAH